VAPAIVQGRPVFAVWTGAEWMVALWLLTSQ
jgi:hypothetical protein